MSEQPSAEPVVEKPRSSPKRGVRHAAVAYCKVCNWYGPAWMGKDAFKNAHGELAWHRESAKCQ